MEKVKSIQERIEEIREELRAQGYEGKAISYEELQALHKIYAEEVGEKVFAQEVLGLTYGNYMNMKNRGQRGKILKKKRDLSEEKIEQIREELRAQGYEGKAISYEELQALHKAYAEEVDEKVFAQEVLGLADGSYRQMKNVGYRGKILKKKRSLSEERIEEIKEKLRTQGYEGRTISYEELQALHKIYAEEVNEKIFAQEVLGLTYSNYMTMKNRGQKGKILKIEGNLSKARIEEIREKLKAQGYEERLITYQELQVLHKKYTEEVDETVFAQEVLGFTYVNYVAMKNRGTKGRILKKKENLSEERIKEIRRELRKQGYEGRLITYEELQALHKKYAEEVKEKVFSQEVLGLTDGNYYNMKSKKGRARVLKSKENLSEERIKEIRRELRKQGYEGRLITYEELQFLHKTYAEEVDEKVFSQEVLGLTYGHYMNMKNKGQRGKILKKKGNLSEERVEEIKEELKAQGYEGRAISYEELQALHKTYAEEVEERVFAQEVLGLTYNNYELMKIRGQRGKILKQKGKLKGERKEEIREELREQGYEEKLRTEPETIMNRLKELVEEGKDKQVALATVVEEFDISKQELLSIMATYLNHRRKIEVDSPDETEQDGYGEVDD